MIIMPASPFHNYLPCLSAHEEKAHDCEFFANLRLKLYLRECWGLLTTSGQDGGGLAHVLHPPGDAVRRLGVGAARPREQGALHSVHLES